jgi:hypothetical protein
MENPKPGKKRGRVKDKDGVVYQISPVLMAMMKMESTYEITFTDETFTPPGSTDTLKYRVIESLTPAIGGASAPPPQQAAPRYNPPGNMGSDDKDESIATLAIIKCQQLPVGDRAGILHALKASALAWRDFKKWQKSVSSDMDGDEVPYDR